MHTIILASQSPRRKWLLEQVGLTFQVIVSNAEEVIEQPIPVVEVPVYLADKKAAVVQTMIPQKDAIIIAADTVVVLEDEILGKPSDVQDAYSILQKLSNQTHQVVSGVVILQGEKKISFSEITHVSFDELSENQIHHYIQHHQPFDKAGAYAIQEWIGMTGIKGIQGDYYNVMGLPIKKLVEELKNFGIRVY